MSQVMNTHKLQSALRDFTGTQHYHRVLPRLLITDGVHFLANTTNAYWLVSAIYSHLVTQPIQSALVVARLTVVGTMANLVLDDGNGGVICEQHIEYTEFPLDEVTFYCSYECRYWVLLLDSEY